MRMETDVDLRLFASGARGVPADVASLGKQANRYRGLRFPTRWKNALWTRAQWPPLEWFTGRADIVHGGFHLLPPASRAKRVVTVFDLAGMRRDAIHDDASLALHRSLLAHAVPNADGILAISQSCRADVIDLLGADPDRVHVVPGGVALEEFTAPPDPDVLNALKNEFRITGPYWIHLGTLEPRKNLPRLLRAYGRLRACRDDVPQLVLAGGKGWMYEPIFETIASLGLEGTVRWTDYLGRADVVALLQGASACVYPSLYEGFGLPVLEAMAARVPVLTSNVSALPEVVGDTGILVAPEDEASIEAGLARLLADSGSDGTRVEAAFARAQGMGWEASARALHRAYRAVLDGTGPVL